MNWMRRCVRPLCRHVKGTLGLHFRRWAASISNDNADAATDANSVADNTDAATDVNTNTNVEAIFNELLRKSSTLEDKRRVRFANFLPQVGN